MKNSRRVTWKEVEEYIERLRGFNESQRWTGVYGVPRGGLVLATMISYRLNIPLLMAPCKNCVIVDDIADTGRSLSHYTENETQYNKYFITTMFYKEGSIVTPDYWFKEKEDNWITFPWEVAESSFCEDGDTDNVGEGVD